MSHTKYYVAHASQVIGNASYPFILPYPFSNTS